MDRNIKYFALAAAMTFGLCLPCVAAGQQPQEAPDVYELAEKEADRLTTLLDLEVWQTFYVDSTLKYNFPAMQEEMDKLQKAKVSNYSMYIAIQDKWMEKTDSSYMKIFNEKQWQAYLKSGAAKQQKARAKRREQAAATIEKKK